MSEQEERQGDLPPTGQDASDEAGPYGEGGTSGKSEQSGEWPDAAGPYGEEQDPADEG
jgi:hypothetical protein